MKKSAKRRPSAHLAEGLFLAEIPCRFWGAIGSDENKCSRKNADACRRGDRNKNAPAEKFPRGRRTGPSGIKVRFC